MTSLDGIREAMTHLEAAHRLLEPYYQGKHRPFAAVDGMVAVADGHALFAFNIIGGLLEYAEPRALAAYTARTDPHDPDRPSAPY